LDPRQIAYLVNLGHLFVSNNRDAEARSLAERVRKAAHTGPEQKMAQGLLDQMRDHQLGLDQSKP
jgi:hypothetical protein